MDRRRSALTRLALNHSELAGGGKEWGKITMRKKVKMTSLPARQTKRLSVRVNVYTWQPEIKHCTLESAANMPTVSIHSCRYVPLGQWVCTVLTGACSEFPMMMTLKY